jgi:hypothetical protein
MIGDLVRVKEIHQPYLRDEYLGIGWVVGLPPYDNEGMTMFPYAEIYFVSGQHTSMFIENLEVVATIYNRDAS